MQHLVDFPATFDADMNARHPAAEEPDKSLFEAAHALACFNTKAHPQVESNLAKPCLVQVVEWSSLMHHAPLVPVRMQFWQCWLHVAALSLRCWPIPRAQVLLLRCKMFTASELRRNAARN